jgi:hypothetical protein
VVRAKVLSKDMGVGENGAKMRVTREYSPTWPRAKLRNKHLWIKGSCRGKGIELELADKTWAHKKNSSCKFSQLPVRKCLVESAFPYALSPRNKGGKWNTIGVARKASAKLPHCMGLMLTYPMENKMPLIHHAIEQWGCRYTNEDNKGLSERIQRHLMLRPKSKLMKVEWG